MNAIGGPGIAKPLGDMAWWVHNLAVLVMLNFLPLAKHFHVITSLPNVFFSKLEPLGQLSKPEYDENTVNYGTSHIDQFTWKQVLDMFSCTECGRCSSQCPATATGKPLAPRQLLLDLRDYLYAHKDEVVAKRVGVASNGAAARRRPRSARTSSATGDRGRGPVVVQHVPGVRGVVSGDDRVRRQDRRHAPPPGAGGGTLPERADTASSRAWRRSRTPGASARRSASSGPTGSTSRPSPTSPTPSTCTTSAAPGAFDDRNKKTTQAFARLLKKAGVDFACLAQEEPCNGDSARRLGNEYLYQSMAQMAVETFNGYNVKKVIVNCPHCFNTIKNEFPQFGGNYEVVHAADLVKQLIAAGQARAERRLRQAHRVPRLVLLRPLQRRVRRAARRAALVGRARSRRCRTATTTSDAAAAPAAVACGSRSAPTSASTCCAPTRPCRPTPRSIAVSCPFCMTMLTDGIKAKDLEDRVQTLDVMEIVDRATR